jgi:flagellar motility protein MotE (MotC chaperone)
MKKRFVLVITAVLIPLLLCGFIYHFSTTAAALNQHKADLEREEVSLTCRKEAALKSLQDYARFEETVRAFNTEKEEEIASLTEKAKSIEERIGDVNAIKDEVDKLRSQVKEVREILLKALSGKAPSGASAGQTDK